MRKSKFLSILLALCLTLSLLPVSAMADEQPLPADADPSFWDTLTLTRADGTALVEGTDYTITKGTYYHYAYTESFTYNIYNVTTADAVVISGGAQYQNASLINPLKSRVVLGAATANVTLSGVTALGELSIAEGSTVNFTLMGDNYVDYIYGKGATTNMIFGGEGSLTGKHIGGVNKYNADPATNVSCNITINSGTYNMTAGYESAIGGGQYGNAGTITINGGNITAKSNYGAAIGGGQNGAATSVIITDGQVNATGSFGAAIGGGQNGGANSIKIEGGLIEARGSHIGAAIGGGQDGSVGTVEITDGDITAIARKMAIGGENAGDITISGGSIKLGKLDSSSKEIPADASQIGAASGGTVNEIKISGGTFNVQIPKDYCEEGFDITDDGNGNYTVAEPKIAAINGVTYGSLDKAIAAVKDGETITILAADEYTLNGSLAYTGKAFTIEAADGVDVAFDMSAAVALHGAKITFKGVTFNYKTNGNYIGIQHADTLVYNNCTINGQVFLYAASETFNGCTFNQTSADAYNVWTYGAKNVVFNHCTFNCVGKSVLVYNEGAVSSTDLTVTDTEFKASAPVAGKAAIEIDTSLMSGGATITIDAVTESKVSGFGTGSISGNSLWNDKKQTEDTNSNTTVTVADTTVFAPRVATVGGVTYSSLEAAFAALTTTNHTLTLTSVGEAKWAPATPVYWKAGNQSGYAATLKAALTAAQTGTDSVLIVYRPGATVTASNDGVHYDVTNNLTIYANNADFSGKDLSIGTYAAPKNSETTINIYDAKNLVVWGQPVGDRADVWNVNFVDCENNGHNFLMYRGSETGKATLNATLTGCKATGFSDSIIHTTADGSIKITNCTFADNCAPVNIAHKQSGSMVVEIEGCTFTNCGKVDESNNYFAPVRMVNNNAQGTLSVSVKNTAFAGTIGENGDILLGDGRNGKESYDVSATVTGTAAKIVAQRPGHYNGSAVDQTKQESKTLTANDTLSTTLNEMLPLKGTVTFDEFLAMVEAYGYNFDGAAVTGDGSKLVVKWSPVNGCFDTRAGHKCTVNNVAATGNTPKRVNNGLTQFQLYEGESYNVTVKNVSFVYEPAAFTVCENSGWAGSFTAEQAPAGQLYYMTTGDVTFESCDFDKVVLTTFNTTGTSTVKNCTLANVYNNYAIKDIRGEHIIVTGNTITNCGGGVMVSSTGTVSDVNISGNTFTNVDVAGTAPADKVGKRALIQIASSGNYTDAELILDGNTASNCGPILRQLNQGIADNDVLSKNLKGDLTGLGGKLTFTGDSVKKASEGEPSQPTIYTVKFSGSDVADKKVVSGTTIDLPTAAKSGYTFNGWYDGSTKVSSPYKVTKDVTLTASWSYNYSGGGSSYDPTYSVSTPSKTENGTVTVTPSNASKGTNVTVTVKPNEGYELGSLAVKDANGNLLPLADLGNGKFSFVMPASKVSVEAEFVKTASTSFADVPANAYFADAVKWAVDKGITNGLSDTMFGPYESCTRAQIVTFLWRAAGSPELKTASSFTDVPANAYYAKAVAWAVENGITNGMTETTFAPDATCTRGQSVTFLYRALKGTASGSTNFTDVASDAFYADAISWAVANNVTNGTSNTTFSPNADCTRAEIVTFLYRAYQGK